ncbi:asparagine synthetase B family protein [Pseudorhodoferax sp.]|uniref:asparagine synthetase B family protein n=1 Tax=Pseudorhodoferax sp. TaxID=1993553 RepID=UPI002DD6269C|nr:asparagine synthase-related protein [Pseudorhodoferax sp.]
MAFSPEEVASASHGSPACVIGHPSFQDGSHAQLLRQQGAEAAWRAAFAQGGPQCAAKVSGDFAIGLRTGDGRVFLAVDRFGMRSLCYRQVGDQLLFAERADALADAGSDIDRQAVYDYLFFHVIPSPHTIYRDVRRVPPGHYVLFEQGRLVVAPYWVARFDEPRDGSFGPLREEFLATVERAVRTQAEGHAPERVGCFLSGGTDSSTVAGMACKVLDRAVPTYSIGFDAQGYDEMEYARMAARHFKTDHHELYVTPADLVRDIPLVAGSYDQPFGNSSALPAYHCARMAKQDGIDKLLAGDGGDELFGGNTRYAKQRVFGWYDGVPQGLRRGLLEPLFGLPGVDKIPLVKKGASYIEQARVPLPDRTEMYNLLRRLGTSTVLTPDFVRQVDEQEPLRSQRTVWQAAQADALINRMLAFDWRYTLAENDLPKVCGTTRLAQVEVGFPLLDQQLLDFSMRLPPEYKLKGLKLRWFFKEALRGFLPDGILTKKKHGFGLPFGVWACQDPALRALMQQTLASLQQRNIVQPAFLRSLVDELLPAHPGYYGELVWILMMLEQWLQQRAPAFKI